MKKSTLCAAAVLLSAFTMMACVSCGGEALEEKVPHFNNPIYSIVANNSGTRVGEADPWVYKHTDGYYYYSASYGSTFDQIRIRRAKSIDLLDSNDESEVATIVKPQTGNFSGVRTYLWAPEIHYIDGTWYLFFTAVCNDNTDAAYSTSVWAVKNYVAKCEGNDPMTGSWSLCGRVRMVYGDTVDEAKLEDSSDVNYMDLSLFRHAGDGAQPWIMNLDGTPVKIGDQWYFAWAQNIYDDGWADEGDSGDSCITYGGVDHPDVGGTGAWSSILIGKVVPGSDFTRVTNVRPVTSPQYLWECGKEVYDENGQVNSPAFESQLVRSPTVNVNEGPAFLHRNGKVFLIFSASACDATYCLGMLTADENADLCDPKSWTKSEKPVFTSSVRNKVFGVGHCSFTTYKGYDVIVYHARQWAGLYSYWGRTNNFTKATEGLQDPYRTGRAKVFTWNEDGTPNFGEAE